MPRKCGTVSATCFMMTNSRNVAFNLITILCWECTFIGINFQCKFTTFVLLSLFMVIPPPFFFPLTMYWQQFYQYICLYQIKNAFATHLRTGVSFLQHLSIFGSCCLPVVEKACYCIMPIPQGRASNCIGSTVQSLFECRSENGIGTYVPQGSFWSRACHI